MGAHEKGRLCDLKAGVVLLKRLHSAGVSEKYPGGVTQRSRSNDCVLVCVVVYLSRAQLVAILLAKPLMPCCLK